VRRIIIPAVAVDPVDSMKALDEIFKVKPMGRNMYDFKLDF
jgi:hypothetical protein